MSAKEMFKELGYKKYLDKRDKRINKYAGYEAIFRYRSNNSEVTFNGLDRYYTVHADIFDIRMDVCINTKLHMAIHKQIEELGWLEDK